MADNWTKEHRKEYDRKRFLEKKDFLINQKNIRMKANRRWLNELKHERGCSRCQENDPVCLDFHHKNKSLKEYGIATISGWSRESILEEIEKCEILCSNCHRKEHIKM